MGSIIGFKDVFKDGFSIDANDEIVLINAKLFYILIYWNIYIYISMNISLQEEIITILYELDIKYSSSEYYYYYNEYYKSLKYFH